MAVELMAGPAFVALNCPWPMARGTGTPSWVKSALS
jgi:hypothetical protein